MSDLINSSLRDLSAALAARKLSAVELATLFLDRIEKLNPALNAFITTDRDKTLAQARAADATLKSGDGATALTGIPVAHKDIFCTRGWRTTCGSKILANFISPYDANVVEKLDGAGMVTLGKLNMDEFAMGSSNETSYFGPVKNPWDVSCVPGGSSGGSAAAISARLAPAATGTDTGGSIRQPAAVCGLTGLKPTYGVVSRYGMIAFASSLDQGGPMAKSAEDCALLLNAMAGFDADDHRFSCQGLAAPARAGETLGQNVVPFPRFQAAPAFFVAPLAQQHVAQIESGLGITAVQFDGPAIAPLGLAFALHAGQEHAQIRPGCRRIRRQ